MSWPRGLLDEHAVGRPAFWIAVPIGVLGVFTVLPEGQSVPTNAVLVVVASVMSTALMGLGLLLGATPVRLVLAHPVRLAITVLCVALFAGGLRGLGVALAFALDDVQDSQTALGRTLASAVVFAVWFALIGGFLASWNRYQAERQVLLDELITRQLQLRLLDTARPEMLGDETTSKLEALNAEVRDVLDQADASEDGQYEVLSQALTAVIEKRMRPLLHDIWQEDEPDTTARPSTPPFLARAFLTRVPMGWALPIYGLIVLLASVVTVGARLGVAAASIEAVTFAAIVLVERRLFPTPLMLPRIAAMVFAGVAPVLLAWLAVGEQTDPQVTMAAAVSLLITGPGVIFGSCAARAAMDEGGPSVDQLRALLDDDEWDRKLQALETHSHETELASVLHNTVQARLYAAVIQLRTAAAEGDDERARAALDHARRAITETGQRSTRGSETASERLSAMAVAWRGIVDVTFECPVDLVITARSKLVVDAAEECVANAIRHAHARNISVRIEVADGGILLVVTDDGDAVTSADSPGLGTVWMEKVSGGQFARVRTERGTNVVTMRVSA